jgi:hypothetical protein
MSRYDGPYPTPSTSMATVVPLVDLGDDRLLAPETIPERTPASQGHIWRGQYLEPLRSAKGKIKGLCLNTTEGSVEIKLPKYLRPMLVRELVPGGWVQVWAFLDGDRWRAIKVLPWPEPEVPPELKVALTVQTQKKTTLVKAQSAPVCIQVCRKGKCFKQGGQQIWSALQAEVEANPNLHHVAIEATGCMNACKHGPNLRVLPDKKMHSRVTPDRALALLDHCQ